VLGVGDYNIVSEEAGSLALSDAISPGRLGQHVMAIVAKGGLVKPSTGFGFHRIQVDSAAIVRSLLLTGLPWNVPAVSERHRH
jgi:lycopene beta-cyclase